MFSQIRSFKILKKKIHAKMKKNVYFVGNFKKIVTKKLKINNKNFFLVIPEGIYSECEEFIQIFIYFGKKI